MNWIKLGDGEWYHKEDKYSYVKVFKTGLSSHQIKVRGIKPYIFMARRGRNGREVKRYFNRLYQAEEVATKYMTFMEAPK